MLKNPSVKLKHLIQLSQYTSMAFEPKEIHFKPIQQAHIRGQGMSWMVRMRRGLRKGPIQRSCALWEQPRYPLMTEEWIKKRYIYTLEYSVQFSCSVVSNSLRPHESQHARPPCPSPTPGVHSDSC